MTLGDLIQFGRADRPWEFLPLAARALVQVPDAHMLRLLAAANFAKLGLRALACECLDDLPHDLRAEPSAAALSRLVEQLPDDRIPRPVREQRARDAWIALRARAVAIAGADAPFEQWARSEADVEAFRTRDGNVVRRDAATRGSASRFFRWADDVGAAAALRLPPLGPAAAPFTIEGVLPPWLLMRVCREAPRQPDGFWPRIRVVQRDVGELLTGLSMDDLADTVAQTRLEWHVGPDAARGLRAALHAQRACVIAGPSVTLPGSRAPGAGEPAPGPDVERIIADAAADQERERAALQAHVAAQYAPRDAAWWARRFAAALAGKDGGGPPLRVLIPTYRLSTYVRHASADLAEALRGSGCRVELLMEPDESSRLCEVAYLRVLKDFDPDLMVLINYPRRVLGTVIPANLPFVTWIQDAMPHQFDERAGAGLGPLDFLIGFLHRELFTRFGYRRDARRTLDFPIVVSPAKFHPGPIGPDAARRHECELAFVSHHGQTPEALHDQLAREAAADRALSGVMNDLRDPILALARAPMSPGFSLQGGLNAAVARAVGVGYPDLDDAGRARAAVLVNRLYASRIAERAIRHQTVAWAAEIAERRGWRLHLYGRAWETHPTLGRHARGELTHGEDLRACYRAARVHLHASSNQLCHQRVMECALSGGLPLCRLHDGELGVIRHALWRTLALRCEPDVTSGAPAQWGDAVGFTVADHPEAMAYAALLQRLGWPEPHGGVIWIHRARLDAVRADAAPLPDERRADWLLGDLAETTFWSPQGLERTVMRAVEDDDWRAGWSAFIAARVRARLTTDRLARRTLELVCGGLGEPRP
ncbi:MAG: hypothetical protein JNM07_11320 [Phycisphaerae bacterium]|nr:hypothetical protein [Phycisphaerae bacterium]